MKMCFPDLLSTFPGLKVCNIEQSAPCSLATLSSRNSAQAPFLFGYLLVRGDIYALSLLQIGTRCHFSSEMLIKFSGLQNIDKQGVLLFPRPVVCLDCGTLRCVVPARELCSLQEVLPPQIRSASAS